MSFTASIHQNPYLADGATDVHAIVSVTAGQDIQAAATATERCVVFMIDDSGSMADPMSKIHAARAALSTAIEVLPDGVRFAIVAGNHRASVVYPRFGDDVVAADDESRAEAAELARRIEPSGGTAISTWLEQARALFDGHPDAIKLAYLLTDGKNESETPEALTEELARCTGQFQCDARGVGAKWEVDELRRITHALLGEVDLLREPEQMQADFTAFLERAMGKALADVRLHVWSPKGATIRSVKQVSPAIDDLTDAGQPDGELVTTFPTGSWAAGESRDYHVAIDVPPGDVGQEKLAARIGVLVGADQVTQGLVRALWTEDHALTTRIDPQVAHYTGQAELAQAIAEGIAARKAGDHAEATIKLGKAVKLAHESGNEGTIRILQKVVDIEDPATGTIRVKRRVDELDEMELDTRSTRTVRTAKKEA
ncbi:MAG TPA: VWA domain-containing protein [Nitriliruptorales bacterium]